MWQWYCRTAPGSPLGIHARDLLNPADAELAIHLNGCSALVHEWNHTTEFSTGHPKPNKTDINMWSIKEHILEKMFSV